jgi:hypothetical protein
VFSTVRFVIDETEKVPGVFLEKESEKNSSDDVNLKSKVDSPKLVVFISEDERNFYDFLLKICASVGFKDFEVKVRENNLTSDDQSFSDLGADWVFIFDSHTKTTSIERLGLLKILKTFSLSDLNQNQSLKANLWSSLKEIKTLN